MKATILITILLLGAGTLTAVYTYKAPTTTDIDVLRDITDSAIAQPDPKGILSMYNLSGNNMWNGGIFSYSDVSDVSYNKTTQVKIEAVNQWLSNELSRNKEVKDFDDSITNVILNAQKDSIGKTHSSIYIPLASELNLLSQSKSQRRILIVYSDLMENDLDVSLYAKKEFQLLSSNPDSLKKLFERWQLLSSLTGIEIFLVYQPANAVSDQQYRVVSQFYKNMLEAKGAEVTIKANL